MLVNWVGENWLELDSFIDLLNSMFEVILSNKGM